MGQQTNGFDHFLRISFRPQIFRRDPAVFHRIMQERCNCGHLIRHLFRQMEGMEYIGHTALIRLVFVSLEA